MSKPESFFRGSELPRMLVLLVILIGGMVLLWKWVYYKNMGPPPEEVARAPLGPIVPDNSMEFETVADKTKVRFRDNAAYELLLKRVRDTAPGELANKSRRDVLSYQIWEPPEHYRGVPIHILGTARRCMTYDSKLSSNGQLYEAWVVTSDSNNNPYCCVFENIPTGFPIGDNISERITFNGYFLKLMAYRAGDTVRVSPLLVGRLGWSAPVAAKEDSAPVPWKWMAFAVAIMFVISFIRWMTGLHRSLAPLSRSAALRERPNEEISSEDFAQWADNLAADHSENESPDSSV